MRRRIDLAAQSQEHRRIPRRRARDEDLESLLPAASFPGFTAGTELVVFRDRVVIETVDRRNLRRLHHVFPLREMAAAEVVPVRGTLACLRLTGGAGRQGEVVFGSMPAAREARDAVVRLLQERRLGVAPVRGPRRAG